jgi:hypothetical protein
MNTRHRMQKMIRKVESAELLPARFVVTIGGFAAPHYEVRWIGRRLRYRNYEIGSHDSHAKVVPTAQQWQEFWASMDRIGVWDWQQRYDNPYVVDGIQWEIDLSDGVRRVRCFGSNKYPGGRNLERGRPFRQFLAAVEALVRQPFG